MLIAFTDTLVDCEVTNTRNIAEMTTATTNSMMSTMMRLGRRRRGGGGGTTADMGGKEGGERGADAAEDEGSGEDGRVTAFPQ